MKVACLACEGLPTASDFAPYAAAIDLPSFKNMVSLGYYCPAIGASNAFSNFEATCQSFTTTTPLVGSCAPYPPSPGLCPVKVFKVGTIDSENIGTCLGQSPNENCGTAPHRQAPAGQLPDLEIRVTSESTPPNATPTSEFLTGSNPPPFQNQAVAKQPILKNRHLPLRPRALLHRKLPALAVPRR